MDRVHNCPVCGLILERDHNAAINILKKCRAGHARIDACVDVRWNVCEAGCHGLLVRGVSPI